MDAQRVQIGQDGYAFWEFVSGKLPKLSKLVLVLLRIHLQSAVLERVFPVSGIYHTHRKNCLAYQKVVKIVRVKAYLLPLRPRPIKTKTSLKMTGGPDVNGDNEYISCDESEEEDDELEWLGMEEEE